MLAWRLQAIVTMRRLFKTILPAVAMAVVWIAAGASAEGVDDGLEPDERSEQTHHEERERPAGRHGSYGPL